jgi:uncharacterized membrane protein
MTEFHSETARKVAIRQAWMRWALLAVPLSVALMIAVSFVGFGVMMPLLTVFLAAVLLYQRYVKKRSWHSIMWGVYADKE